MGSRAGIGAALTMLRSLHIRNLAIIDALSVDLDGGFSVLSGETGAGKSILIDALGLVLGDRADSNLVRAAAEKAEISAEFSLESSLDARGWLREQSMEDPEQPDHCLLRRVIGRDGRSRAYINGTPAPVTNLRQLGEHLVEIHGQNEHQALLRPDAQRLLLDEFADAPDVIAAVRGTATAWADTRQAIEDLRRNAARDPAQLDYLRHLLGELDALDLREGELDQLERDHRRLANAGKLVTDGNRVGELLGGDEGSAQAQLAAALDLLGDLEGLDPAFGSAHATLSSADVQIRDALDEVARTLDRLELDPGRLEEMERRLAAIHDLARKHQVRPEVLAEKRTALSDEIQGSEGAEERLKALEVRLERQRQDYGKAASKLTRARRAAAGTLAARVTTVARELGMPKAVLEMAIEHAAPASPRVAGDDDVEFRFSANPGQPARPMAKVASGGELSRLSLAIQCVAHHARTAGTLIFDEVDAGIGGATAEAVGRMLRQLAERRQVLCVTHLPQVAALGHRQYSIDKTVRSSETHTTVTPLDGDGRVAELARMLGGRDVSKSSAAHARDLLRRGQAAS